MTVAPLLRRRRPLATLLAAAATTFAVVACSGVGVPGGVTPLPTLDAAACPTKAPEPLVAGQTRIVEIKTAKGSITIKVEADLGPRAAGNFVALAGCGFYNGLVFHRVVRGFVIQGGDPTGTGKGGPGYEFPDDPVSVPYARGVVAMANSGPNTNGSQFFIVLADSGLDPDYSVFGRVTSGMEAVDAIATAADAEQPTHPIAMDALSVANP